MNYIILKEKDFQTMNLSELKYESNGYRYEGKKVYIQSPQCKIISITDSWIEFDFTAEFNNCLNIFRMNQKSSDIYVNNKYLNASIEVFSSSGEKYHEPLTVGMSGYVLLCPEKYQAFKNPVNEMTIYYLPISIVQIKLCNNYKFTECVLNED